jgi:hypothetical protein
LRLQTDLHRQTKKEYPTNSQTSILRSHLPTHKPNEHKLLQCSQATQPEIKTTELLSGHDEKLETAAGSRRSKSNTKTPLVKERKKKKKQNHIQH